MRKLICMFLILLSLTVTAQAVEIDPHTQMDQDLSFLIHTVKIILTPS